MSFALSWAVTRVANNFEKEKENEEVWSIFM